LELKDKVQDLINLKQEGAYWDFKREWYSKDKIAYLLHDIICMTNNLENTDSFIIIGIDEENSYKVRSVSTDSNRMNTPLC
jgi:cob(I)alamin adenosyltransferase